MYQAQITELLSNYGPIFEMWFDGANGGDGYYGGACEKRSIDSSVYYDWPNTWGIVRKLQPMACIFGDVGPDSRWVGNEKGYAAEDSWATFTPKGRKNPDRPSNGDSMNNKEGPAGHRDGANWIPPECDLPLRKGWFWHPDQDATVRSPSKLMDIYFNSVGKGGCMNLGVAPNRDGFVCDADIKSLDGFGTALKKLYAVNFAKGAAVTASAVRAGGDKISYNAANVIDDDRYTYWATNNDVKQGELTLTLAKEAEFDVIRLRENIKLGQRVDGFAVDTWQNGAWKEFAGGKSIGASRLIRGEKVKSSKLRLRITAAAACPCISDIGIFKMPQL
jgi:alpha-L-fucosidase